MSPELATALPQSHEPFSVEEYIKVRELGGVALGDILNKYPYFQVQDLCGVATKEFDLHGDEDFVKKNLDAAIEATQKIGGGVYIPGGPYTHNQGVRGYINIAKAAVHTGQETEYVYALLDAASEEVLENGASHSYLMDIAAMDHELDPDSGRAKSIITLAVRQLKYLQIYPGGNYRDMTLSRYLSEAKQEYGFDDEFIDSLIDAAREQNRTLERDGNKAKKLADMAKLAKEYEYRDGAPDAVKEIIEEGRKLAVVEDDINTTVSNFIELAKASHDTDQPEEHAKEILEQAAAVALAADQSPRNTIAQIRELIIASMELKQFDYNDEYLTQPAIDLIRSADISARVKHQLLNQLIGQFNLPEDFMEANGIEKKPLSYVFKS